MKTQFTLILPKNRNGESSVSSNQSIIFIGANGSGKSRLGAWIDLKSPQKEKVHRVSAQKSLSMPDTSTPMSIERAEKNLLYGSPEAPLNNASNYKAGHKWGNRPVVNLLNDFEKLMVYLFSEHTELSSQYLQASKQTTNRIEPPITKLEKIKQVWEVILPHRELVLGGLRIQTKVKDEAEQIYNSSDMSDGERVIFYLVGQCLSAAQDSIIIIDEPELHLQKSIQEPLWAAIEYLRPDCLFVYFTHDVEFASSKKDSQKVWIKSFDGSNWDWELIEPTDNIPEELLFKILGSRKPILFVEGTNESFDVALYRNLIKSFLIIPIGSCNQVIDSVKSLRLNTQLHHLQILGLIDRDRRGSSEIHALEQDGIYTLEVAEVENLFCTEEILNLVSTILSRDPVEDFSKAAAHIFANFNSEIENQISLRVVNEIKFKLNLFNQKAIGINDIKNALSTLFTGINPDKLYQDTKSDFEQINLQKQYSEVLKFYNRKSLSDQICKYYGFTNGELVEFIIRLSSGSRQQEVKDALKKYFGNFVHFM